MSKVNTILQKLRGIFQDDRVAMYYHGNFDDRFTDKLISIADYDIAKKNKRRMAFLISESFQNIIRHGESDLDTENAGLFGVRGIDPYLHIFSSNLISSSAKDFLATNIDTLNNLNEAQLADHYREVLSKGKINEKGGAGLGLIEMAKKSHRPLQTRFVEKKGEIYTFNLQIDLIVNEDEKVGPDDNPVNIDSNNEIYDTIIDNDILFVYKGEFSEELIAPLIKLLEDNAAGESQSMGFKIYTTAIEMMQNISSHASGLRPRKDGLFIIQYTAGGYYLATGNYIDGNGQDVLKRTLNLNSLSREELDRKYRHTLKQSVVEERKNANVGLIDIRRTLMNDINSEVLTLTDGNYLMMGIEITAEE